MPLLYISPCMLCNLNQSMMFILLFQEFLSHLCFPHYLDFVDVFDAFTVRSYFWRCSGICEYLVKLIDPCIFVGLHMHQLVSLQYLETIKKLIKLCCFRFFASPACVILYFSFFLDLLFPLHSKLFYWGVEGGK